MSNSHGVSNQPGFAPSIQGLSYQDLLTAQGSSGQRAVRMSQDSEPQGFSAALTLSRTTSNSSSPELLNGNRLAVKRYQEKKKREESEIYRRHEQARDRNALLRRELHEKKSKYEGLMKVFKEFC